MTYDPEQFLSPDPDSAEHGEYLDNIAKQDLGATATDGEVTLDVTDNSETQRIPVTVRKGDVDDPFGGTRLFKVEPGALGKRPGGTRET